MVLVALVLFTLLVVALGAWTGRRQHRMDYSMQSANHRLGIHDPRDTPYGPPSGL